MNAKKQDEKAAKIKRYSDLLEFSQFVNSSMDFKIIQKKSTSKIKKLLNCEHVQIYRVDVKNHELYNKGPDNSDEGFDQTVIAIDEHTFAGACAHYNAVLHIKDVKADIRYKRQPKFLKHIDYRNILLVPMTVRGEVLGVIEAINSKNKDFSEDDIHFAEDIASQITPALEKLNILEKFNNQFIQVCEALADATLKKDRYTGGHTKRVVIFSEMIAKELDLSFGEMNNLILAAVLHDFGKIGIADKILQKDSQLTDEEFEIMKEHPRLGYEILGHIESLGTVVDGIRYHHERYDGNGYPYALKGNEIPLIAQIISVADTFDAMISNRPYRKGLPAMVAYEEIIKCSGTQFAPIVVEAFDRAFKKTNMYHPEELESFKKAS